MSSEKNKIAALENQVAELKQQVNMLDSILAALPGHVYWKDKDGILLGCNNEQANSAGLTSRGQIKGLKPIDLIDVKQPENERKKQATAIAKNDREVLDGNKTIIAEEIAVQPNGAIHTFISKKVPIHDDAGNVIGLAGSTLDITKQKQLEKQLVEANKFKTSLMEASDKILRTPVSTIITMAQTLSIKHSDQNTSDKYVDVIMEAAKSIPPLLARFGLYAAVDQSDYYFDEEDFSLTELLIDILKKDSVKLERKKKIIGLSINDFPAHIHASSVAFTEIFMTLSRLVSKYNTGDKVNVLVSLRDSSHGVFTIKFQNASVAKLAGKDLFNFIDNIPDTMLVDIALELSIVAKIVSLLHGQINVKAQSENEVELNITLPVKSADKQLINEHLVFNHEKQFNSRPEIQTLKEMPHLRLLVAEDDALCLFAIVSLLESVANVKVDVADSVASAQEKMQQHEYDAIFTDINLPDESGELIIKQARDNDEKLPVIVVTANANEEFRERLIDISATDVILKPATAEDLIKQLLINVYQAD